MLGAFELGCVPNRGRGHHSPAAAPLPPCAKAICGSDYAPRGVTLKWGPASRNYQRCLFVAESGSLIEFEAGPQRQREIIAF